MIRIKTKNKITKSNFLDTAEIGFFKSEDIIIKIGKKEYYLYTIDFYREWVNGDRIEMVIKRNVSKEERKEILLNILKEHTNKEIKYIEIMLWYIEAGENYYYLQEGNRNFEGIRVN